MVTLAISESAQNQPLPPLDVSPKANDSIPDDDLLDDAEPDDESDHDDSKSTSRKRKRPMSVSCETCKQRKVKCDRGQPSCGWCARNSQPCEYKERKKPGLRAGYGRELEARLDRLEDMIQRQQSTIAQLVDKPPVVQTTPHVPKPETALFLQKPSTYYHGRHHSISALPSTYNNNNPPLESPTLNIDHPQLQPAISHQEPDFPPYDLLYALADLYFKHINTWCPILHRRSTLDRLFGSVSLDEADRILLHAIVATTLRFSTDPRLTAENRERYHSISKQKVLLYGLENSSVKALQALVILALDLVGFSNGPPGWNLLALITRSVVQLGLAVENTSSIVSPNVPSIYTLRAMVLPEPGDFIDDENRRRLFWMVYLLDRYATVATAFEFALDEKEIDRKLPCRDEYFIRNQAVETRWFHTVKRTDYSLNKPENLGSFSYYVELVGILSQIHQFLKKPVDIGSLTDVENWQREFRELDNALASWKFGLPGEFGNMSRIYGNSKGEPPVDGSWIMLHAAYHTTVIRLHSSAAYPTTRSPIFTPSYTAIQRCLTAVESISALNDYVRSHALLSTLGTHFAFSLWVAARVLLVHGSTIEHHVDPAITPLVDTLREMGHYWRVAERYATLLQRVLDEYRASQSASAATSGPSAPSGSATAGPDQRTTPSSVKILSDMRRCAFDLDFLISRQPRLQQHAPPSQSPLSGGPNGASPHGSNHLTAHSTHAHNPNHHHAQTSARFPAAMTPHPAAAAAAARTPAPNELEYLDVFDFFNMPRLPVNGVGGGGPPPAGQVLDHAAASGSSTAGTDISHGDGGGGGAGGGGGGAGASLNHHMGLTGGGSGMGVADGFNITHFMVDASADWFMKGGAAAS
ncbi:fungal-specific transcription factor domain-containing protein [Phyllosticta capitalensis]|uniref:fungal-specific transcription factor domain-containing protein n=1 Tax=Phyllosticta capitalensis TaxID=121624 RepID=UPI00312E814B